MSSIERILGVGGELERVIPHFRVRQQQLDMASAVEKTLEDASVLVCEAGTGTGKTFAYLVPVLLSGLKVIISTGTRNLQDQLFNRDLPRIREYLGTGLRASLLKGRANYLCTHRMDAAHFDRRSQAPTTADHLTTVREWAHKTRFGDIAELGMIPEDALVWPLVTSTVENCLGQDCPDYGQCFLVEARRRAQEADLVVINHHLLCADFALKQGGFGELLPAADAYIIDEAHQLPEVANQFFGINVSGRQLQELARDVQTVYRQLKLKQQQIEAQALALDKSTRDFRLLFGLDEGRGPWEELAAKPTLLHALTNIRSTLDELVAVLTVRQGSDEALDACLTRAQGLQQQLMQIVDQHNGEETIRWYETTRLGFRLCQTPLDIADAFQQQMRSHAKAWVFTSATLAVGDSFAHFCAQLGLSEVTTACWDSPFDYQSQALWYVPEDLPEPNAPNFTAQLISQVIPLLHASHGRAFLLFTSYRALHEARQLLTNAIDFPLYVQGDLPKNELLEQFRAHGNAVLLGTSSFWEGVDVQGEALSLVVIDKLPFASPGDPVLQARLDAIKKRGLNPFMQYQVPQAVIAFKQGAGRLIRGEADSGVLVTGDLRLLQKPYGKVFIKAMPPFKRTRKQEDVLAFFAHLETARSQSVALEPSQ